MISKIANLSFIPKYGILNNNKKEISIKKYTINNKKYINFLKYYINKYSYKIEKINNRYWINLQYH